MIVKSKLCWGILATGMASLAICLAACNDNITESKGVESVATFSKLGDCDKDNAGDMVFVADSAMLYYCYEGEWTRVKGLDGEKGEKGDKGDKGDKGTDGTNGERGDDGDDGNDGADGKSAYELAVAAGFTGTEEEWLASLKGEKGDDGADGADGAGCSVAETKKGVKFVCGEDTLDVALKEETKLPVCGGVAFMPEYFFCDVRDSSLYYYVTIGNRRWMAEDLRYIDSIQTPSLQKNFWCKDSCETGERYYNWAAAIDSVKTYAENEINCHDSTNCNFPERLTGLCPRGWHLPTVEEWEGLFAVVGGVENAGWILRERRACYAQRYSFGFEGLNSYDFSATYTGHLDYMEDFDTFRRLQKYGWMAEYWTASTPFMEADKGIAVQISCERKDANFTEYTKDVAMAIRCVR